jgi:hypothetical protein
MTMIVAQSKVETFDSKAEIPHHQLTLPIPQMIKAETVHTIVSDSLCHNLKINRIKYLGLFETICRIANCAGNDRITLPVKEAPLPGKPYGHIFRPCP